MQLRDDIRLHKPFEKGIAVVKIPTLTSLLYEQEDALEDAVHLSVRRRS